MTEGQAGSRGCDSVVPGKGYNTADPLAVSQSQLGKM